jgi:LysM repeat protein
MAKRIYISPSSQVENLYATGNINEKAQCHKIAKACVDCLKKSGFDVKCTYNDSMSARVKESNAFGADMHVAIHTNATSKHNVTGGTQILLYSLTGERYKAGIAVFDALSPVTPGRSAEKIIAYPEFYEINSAKGISVYVEAEFHDTIEGSNFIINNTQEIGKAIAEGICNYYGVKLDSEDNNANTYTVRKGDSLWGIAEKFLGNGTRYSEIKSLNNLKSDTIVTGQVLKIPVVKNDAAIKVGDTVKLNSGAKTHDGKSLASFVYGRKHKVKEINGNRAVITYLGVTVAAVNVKDLTLA